MNRNSIILAALLAAFLALASGFAVPESDAAGPYTVTLDAQGGLIEGTATHDYTYTNKPLYLQTPTRDGHTFLGWYTEPNGGGSRIVGGYTPTGDVTLYASWAFVGYTVSFRSGGSIPDMTYTDTPLDLPEPQKYGYEFDGWYTQVLGGEEAESPFTPSASCILYARWTMNCGTADEPLTSLCTSIDVLCNNGTVYLRAGSPLDLTSTTSITILDASDAEEFGLRYIAEYGALMGPAVKVGTFTFTAGVLSENAEDGGKSRAGGGGVTVTIIFTGPQPTYTVTFDANGGTCETETLTFSGEPLMLPEPSRSGYDFCGWQMIYSDEDYALDNYYGLSPQTLWYEGDEFVPTSDVTLHALWAPTGTCTITLDANSGDIGGEATVTNEFGADDYPLMLPEPSRYGYRFAGWYDQRDGGNPAILSEGCYTPDGDITLYAHWVLAFTGADWYALPSIDAGALDACEAGAFYAAVKGTVNITPQSGYSVTGVTSGFGLTVSDGALTGTLTGAGDITVTVAGELGGDGRTFTIHSVVFPYEIYLHTNGSSYIDTSIVYAGEPVYLPTSSSNSYEFIGWFTEPTGGEMVSNPFVPTEVDDEGFLHLYGQWASKSGTSSEPLSTVRMGADRAAQYGIIRAFAGARVNIQPANGVAVTDCSEGCGLAVSDGALIGIITQARDISVTVNSAEYGHRFFTIRAVQPTYAVTFDPNGGKADIEWMGYLSTPLRLTMPEREGHAFGGWFTEPDGGTDVSLLSYTPTADTILYAHWNLRTGTASEPLYNLEADAQEALDASAIYVGVGGTVSVASSGSLSITGCTEGFGLSVEDGELAGTISQAGTITVTVTDGSRSGDTFTIVAPGTFEVGLGYHGDYGTLTYEGTPLELGTIEVDSSTTFIGWKENSDECNFAAVPSPYTPTRDITLYPIVMYWSTTILHANGGSVGGEPTAAVLYKGTPLELPTPEWEGHTFLGWYTTPYTEADSEPGTDTPNAEGPYELYAHWAFDGSSTAAEPLRSLDASVQEAFDAETIYVEVGSPVMLSALSTDGVAITGATSGFGLSLESGYYEDMLLRSALRGTLTQAGEITVTAEDVSTGATRSLTIFSVQPITVELDAMGGEIAGEEFAYLTYTDTALVLPDPDAREGWTFGGWYDWMVDGERAQSPYAPESRTTLYARWIAETGSPENPLTGISLGAHEAYNAGTLYVTAGGPVSLTSKAGAVEILGCTGGFGLTAADGTLSGTVSKAGTIAVTADVYAADGTHETKVITIAAVTAVVLNAMGGTVDGQSRLALTYEGTPLALPDPDAREGWTFVGWYDWIVDGTAAESPYAPDASEMLYARWIPAAGSQSAPLSTLNQWASDAYNAGTMYVYAGGWIDLKSEPSIVLITGVTSGFGLENVSGHVRGTVAKAGTITVSADVYDEAGAHTAKTFTITAVQPVYTVTLNFNYGTLSTQTMTYDGTPLVLPEPTRAGYAFVGWASNGIKVQNPYTPTKSITLFAQWAPTYTVTLEAEGGSIGGASSATMTYRGTALPLPAPTKDGMSFAGWYDGETKVSSPYTPASDVTLRAHWEEQAEPAPQDGDGDAGTNWAPFVAVIIGALVALVGSRFHPAFVIAGIILAAFGAVWALGWIDLGVRL